MKPNQFGCEKQGDAIIRRVLNYDIRETTDSEILALWVEFIASSNDSSKYTKEPEAWFKEHNKWCCSQVKFPMGVWSYEEVVEAIIRDKYSQSEMESITNNMTAVLSGFLQELTTNGIISATKWIVENVDADNTKHFTEMQQWRKHAKEIAKGIFKKEV